MDLESISQSDLEIIAKAKAALERESVAMRLSNISGGKINILVKRLPDSAQKAINKSVNVSLTKATQWAYLTTGTKRNPILRSDWIHHGAVAVTGGLGGSLGLASTLWELPISTMLMLRSVGCIAEEEGMSMANQKTRLACVSVLAMGANSQKIKGDELGYWVTRKMMASFVTELLEWSGKGTAPVLTRFIMATAARFGLVIGEKVAAQLAPLAGAVTGAAINHIFLTHFQNVAHAHFSIERLSLKYGEAAVKAAYVAQRVPCRPAGSLSSQKPSSPSCCQSSQASQHAPHWRGLSRRICESRIPIAGIPSSASHSTGRWSSAKRAT